MDTNPTVLRYKNYELSLYPPVKLEDGTTFRPWWDPEDCWQDQFETMVRGVKMRPWEACEGFTLNLANEILKANGLPIQKPFPLERRKDFFSTDQYGMEMTLKDAAINPD